MAAPRSPSFLFAALAVLGAAGLAPACIFDLHQIVATGTSSSGTGGSGGAGTGGASGTGGAATSSASTGPGSTSSTVGTSSTGTSSTGTSTSSNATGTSTSSSGGACTPPVQNGVTFLGHCVPDQLNVYGGVSAYGGDAYVVGYSGYVWRVPFNGSPPQKLTPPMGYAADAVAVDGAGVIWAGHLGMQDNPTRTAIGEMMPDGTPAWTKEDLFPPPMMPMAVTMNGQSTWALGMDNQSNPNKSQVVTTPRPCGGCGVPTTLYTVMSYLDGAGARCFIETAGFLTFLTGSVAVNEGTIGRINAAAFTGTPDVFGNGSTCALVGSNLAWGGFDIPQDSYAPAAASAPIMGQTYPNASLYTAMTSDGTYLFGCTGSEIVRYDPTSSMQLTLGPSSSQLPTMAVDDVAVYWIEDAGGTLLEAIAKP